MNDQTLRAMAYDSAADPVQLPDAAGARGRGVQSVEVALSLLLALARANGPVSLRDLSAKVGMSPAKVHRYMASFVQMDFVAHRRSGTYDLGRGASEVGLAAVARVDLINIAGDRLAQIVDETEVSGMLTVWTGRGPTVIRWERGREALAVVLGIGSVLPVSATATGRAFAAYLPERIIEPVLQDETPNFREMLIELRTRNNDGLVFRSDGGYAPGFHTIARPVLGPDGTALAVMTLVSANAEKLAPSAKATLALRGPR